MIKSEDENRFVYDLLRNNVGAHHGWIGLYRKKADNNFYWLDDRPANGSYQNWNKGEPTNSGGKEDCVHLRGGDSEDNWNDLTCSSTDPVAICQWPI